MLKEIKLAKTKQVYLVSDLHINHNKDFIYEARGFKNIEEHNEFIWRGLEEIANDDSVIVNLGDVVLGSDHQAVFTRLSQLPFHRHYLLNGNHLGGMKDIYKTLVPEGQEIYPVKYNYITYLGNDQLFSYGGSSKNKFYCRHFAPFMWDFQQFGAKCYCGHSHQQCSELNEGESVIGSILDVGVDNAIRLTGKPYFTLEQASDIVSKKPFKKHDYH